MSLEIPAELTEETVPASGRRWLLAAICIFALVILVASVAVWRWQTDYTLSLQTNALTDPTESCVLPFTGKDALDGTTAGGIASLNFANTLTLPDTLPADAPAELGSSCAIAPAG